MFDLGKLKLMSERLRKAVIAELETVLRVENDELCRVPGVKIHFESNDKLVNGYTNGKLQLLALKESYTFQLSRSCNDKL